MAKKLRSIEISFGGDPGDFSVLHEYKQEGEYEPPTKTPLRGHSALLAHLHSHLGHDTDENCPLCDGQAGEMEDKGPEEGGELHSVGKKSSKSYTSDDDEDDGAKASPHGKDAANKVKSRHVTPIAKAVSKLMSARMRG